LRAQGGPYKKKNKIGEKGARRDSLGWTNELQGRLETTPMRLGGENRGKKVGLWKKNNSNAAALGGFNGTHQKSQKGLENRSCGEIIDDEKDGRG